VNLLEHIVVVDDNITRMGFMLVRMMMSVMMSMFLPVWGFVLVVIVVFLCVFFVRFVRFLPTAVVMMFRFVVVRVMRR
jgi:hypothetical protein